MDRLSLECGIVSAPPLGPGLNARLSIMMFLQYGIWGAWLPLFFSYLTEYRGFSGEDAGLMFSIAAIGALVAPFVAGQIADRLFNTEKFLGLSHIIGAALVWQLAEFASFWSLLVFGLVYSLVYAPTLSLTNALAFHHLPDRDRDFGKVRVWGTIGWIVVGIGMGQYLLHSYNWSDEDAVQALVHEVLPSGIPADLRASLEDPDIVKGLMNLPEAPSDQAMAVRNVLDLDGLAKDPARLAEIRATLVGAEGGDLTPEAKAILMGGILFSEDAIKERKARHLAGGKADSFKLSAILGLILGLFCFSLPKTPPHKGESPLAFVAAFTEVKLQPLLTLFLVSFPIACVHQFYFVRTEGFLGSLDVETPLIDSIFGIGGGPMTIGQIAEIFVLALMPLAATRFSRKALLTVGLLAYIVRFAVFAYLPYAWAVYPALALHGLCFGCFFFIAFMIIDESTTSDVRASAQSLYNLVIIGVGVIVGNLAAGYVDTLAMTDEGVDFRILFSVPMWVTMACLMALLVLYPEGKRAAEEEE